MVRSIICRVVLLALFTLLVNFVHAETVADSALNRDHQDTISGDPPIEVSTKDPFQFMTKLPDDFDFEESTDSENLDKDQAILGPGAITAIVIAVFLGASVLLALIVITLRKFMAS
ncbi:protein SNORC [Melanotaenia boesemani]|uniref:protein SNORC n=1 Tax=Melanotaenia boesemani TaxID=1250792 RepID=UPI001C03D745|nr:protein SNORC [Melanotaenia boesemani]